ncbi:cytidylyltransferase domain-containing protein [uncultured Ruminococcus sp.]|uniref:acylneuraminate cytidylyltransferase family protein n=1 Tax=uncultured Ruminococcus sp. TaxID=165186 RepID=UPI0025D484D9|nr:NTP transferase domain-containing protein [uncultured Ruminococcus sp.]
MSKKTVAFVPLKLNNERLPGKNTKSFKGGKPLLTYILSTLTKVNGIDEAYVYCSNEEVKKYLPDGIKFLKRSESLDTGSTLIIDVLKAFAKDIDADVYVLTHATAPFIKPSTIETAIEKVKSNEYDSAFTVRAVQEFLWIDGQAIYDTSRIPRTQDINNVFAETTGLYVYTKELIKSGRRIGCNPCGIPVDFIEATDINQPIDFELAQVIFDNYIKNESENNE